MNWLLTLSALLSISIVIGHFTMGRKLYLLPMLNAEFDEVSQKIMHSLFHYSSVFLVLSAIVLTYFSFEVNAVQGFELVVTFIGVNFVLNAVVQIIIALTSKLEKPLMKLFQWTLFLLTGITALLSVTI